MPNKLDNLPAIVELIEKGGIILCPTDTIWGLSCDAFNENSVNKIYQIKQRENDKPFILLTDSVDNLKKYIKHIHPRIETLIHYHLRPISVVYDANDVLPPYLKNKDNTVAFRVTKDAMLCELIQKLNRPIVSTSANISGQSIPKQHADIDLKIIDKVDYVFKTGRVKQNLQSSMLISFDEEGELIFLRK